MKQCSRTFFLSVCVTAAVIGLMLFPQEISRAVSGSVTVCIETLLPTLFPFMVLSGFIVCSGLAEHLGRRFHSLMTPVFHLPGVCFTPFLLGLIGGYPTGAKTAVSLYQSGACSKDEAEHTLAFCNNCGPGFVLGTIGSGIYGDIRYGFLLFISHISAAILTGIILSPATVPRPQNPPPFSADHPSTPLAFVSSVTDSIHSFLNLSAFILCFSAILTLADLTGIPVLIGGLLPVAQQNAGGFLLGLLEMTSGVFRLSSATPSQQLILMSALISWGGLSVHCQVMSILQHSDLSLRLYWRGKILQTILSAVLTACIVAEYSLFIPAGVLTLLLIFWHVSKKSSGNSRESVL